MGKVAIIGAGAAGCLSAIELKRRSPGTEVTVLEASGRPLAKVALTGGGRCNLTNTFAIVRDLREVYPRGARLMKGALRAFSPADTRHWFEALGVDLKEEAGGRIFPCSDDATQIVRTLEREMRRSGVKVLCHSRVTAIQDLSTGYEITIEGALALHADAVIVATGGSPKSAGLSFLGPLGLAIEPPVPSLFTLKTNDPGIKALMGTVAPDAILSLAGTPFRAVAPLLLTDWGFGGPATLKLSSYAARHLADSSYRATLLVNWTGRNEQAIHESLAKLATHNAQKMVVNTPLPGLPARLWTYLLERSALRADLRWAEMGSKGLNRLVSTLTRDPYPITGRAAFKEEFVTCGGVALQNLNASTLEAKAHPGLFLSGEVLDIDAVTGGFNLQAAWTTGWICARSAAEFLKI